MTGAKLGFVVGLAAEARIAERFGGVALAGGGTPAGAADAARRLVERGVTALVSFGLAGGLDPALRPGTIIIPAVVLSAGQRYQADADLAQRFGGLTEHCLLGGTSIAADAATKAGLRQGFAAHAIDLESGSVAATAAADGLTFVAVRAICDPAERDLPPAALLALDGAGGIGFVRVLGSVLGRPSQVGALLTLAGDATRARRSLIQLAKRCQGAASKSNL